VSQVSGAIMLVDNFFGGGGATNMSRGTALLNCALGFTGLNLGWDIAYPYTLLWFS